MKFIDHIILAFDSVILYKFRSLLSILGVTIGVAAVISGIILGVGNRASIMQKLAEGGADVLWFYTEPVGKGLPSLERLAYKPDLPITEEDLQYIKKQCSAVKDVTAYILTPLVLHYGGKHHTIKALGFSSPRAAIDVIGVKMSEGRAISDLDAKTRAKVCVIERYSLAEEIFGGDMPLGKDILIGTDKYKVIGITEKLRFRFGYPERLIVLFPGPSLQETVGIRKYGVVMLTVKSIKDVPRAQIQLRQALLQRFGHPLKFYISTYSYHVKNALEIINLMTYLIIGIAVISLTVGGVGIMNVMMARVVEKTREIGISKAIGAKRISILLLFMIESSILTIVGGGAGILFGIGASKLVTLLVGIPFIVPPWAILLGFFLSVMVGVISGSYPAKRAAELDPAITLRQL